MTISHKILSLVFFIGLLPRSALAHVGDTAGNGFLSALLHPFTGIDHLLILFGFGLLVLILTKIAMWIKNNH